MMLCYFVQKFCRNSIWLARRVSRGAACQATLEHKPRQMDLRDSGRASLRASRVLMPARTEPRPPKDAFPDSQDHATSFTNACRRIWSSRDRARGPSRNGALAARSALVDARFPEPERVLDANFQNFFQNFLRRGERTSRARRRPAMLRRKLSRIMMDTSQRALKKRD